MPRISAFGPGLKARSPYVTAKLLTNMYVEQRPQGEKAAIVGYQCPGLNLFIDFGAAPSRGAQEFLPNGLAYVVQGGAFRQVNNAAVSVLRGTLLTVAGRVSMTDNGVQIMIVDGTYGYIYQPNAEGIAAQVVSSITHVTTVATLTTAAPHGLTSGMVVIVTGAAPAPYNGTFQVTVTGANTFTYIMASDPGANAAPAGAYTVSAFNRITDANFPASPTTVQFLAGRFLVTFDGSGRFYASDLYNGWVWNALNFSNAETNPDPIVAGWVSNGQFIPLGSVSSEFWGQSGSVDFAFSMIQGTATEWGLAARWSIAKYDNSFACLMKNRMGQVMIAQMKGYIPARLSTPDVDAIINGYANTADATALSYMLGGHMMLVMNFPSAGATWLYDASSAEWTVVKSYSLTRYRGDFSFQFLGRTMVADYRNGKLYVLTADALTENGEPIYRELVTETIADADLDRLEVAKFRADFQVGVGLTSGQGVNPQVCLNVSRDNGKTWGSDMWRTLGAIGDYGLTADWGPLGEARNFVFKLSMSDPVPMVLVSASVNPDD